MKTATLVLLAAIGGCLAFFVLQMIANQSPSSFIAQSSLAGIDDKYLLIPQLSHRYC